MIHYLVPDHPEPSWGVGMLYEHVRLLRELGLDARVLHHRSPFRPAWRELEAPVDYLDRDGFSAGGGDVVVVPDVLAGGEAPRRFLWRRVVFVQGSFLILGGLQGAPDYRALGYERAMAVLPHVARVVERHFGLAAAVVPPFVAPYFFGENESDDPPRERRVLLATKAGYRIAGLPDEPIVETLLAREIARRPDWTLARLEGLSHRDVAALMRRSTWLVNVNSHEAFNTTVPEAMAAGCVPVCYEAVGGRDFLRDGENAVVFSNHDVYALVERLVAFLDDPDGSALLLARLREGGRRTAATYRPEETAAALGRFFAAELRADPS
jgi:glycosyltransferase involved in cell wall biosynthesis